MNNGPIEISHALLPTLEWWQVERIEDYVRSILKTLRLSNWHIYMANGEPKAGHSADIKPITGTRTAVLRVNASWWQEAEGYEKAVILTHEALHLTHHDVAEGIFRYFSEQKESVPLELARHVKSTMAMNFERMVDSLALAITKHMPQWQPEWDEAPGRTSSSQEGPASA